VESIAGVHHTVRLEVVPNGMYVSLPIVPNCIYTEPEIATVGITEQTAGNLGMKVRCGVYTMDGNGKSIISREEAGFIRLVFEAYSNSIVGAQIVCPRATDMIGEMATAIANSLTAEQLSMAMRAHPTYSEGIAAAIEDAMK
ncbi:MAG: dihydrolipoyl dehydrogenase, partial [Eubacteriales bacterium]|nr:dihydrolipoyl dehydrogenase [Eubacteriales bacterium]